MSAATEWITGEDRATVEAAIQHEVRTNGHGPLSQDVLSLLVEHAARMVAVHRGSVVSHAVTVARLLCPAPPVTKDRFDALWASMREMEREKEPPPFDVYRPEPPRNRRNRRHA